MKNHRGKKQPALPVFAGLTAIAMTAPLLLTGLGGATPVDDVEELVLGQCGLVDQVDPSAGTCAWKARYSGPGISRDDAKDVIVSPDGSRVFVAGIVPSGASLSAYVAATGEELWVVENTRMRVNAELAVAPDGTRVFMTGPQERYGLDIETAAYDAVTGDELWVATSEVKAVQFPSAPVSVAPDGETVFVTHPTGERYGGQTDIRTVAYEARTGLQKWVATFDGPAGYDDHPSAVAVSPDSGTLYVAGSIAFGGQSYYNPQTALGIIAYDTLLGTESWQTLWNPPAEGSWANAIGIAPDGDTVFATGVTGPYDGDVSSQDQDYATVAVGASDGSVVWSARYNGPGDNQDRSMMLSVHPSGGQVFVSGTSNGAGTGRDYATIAYDASTGNENWAARFDGPGGNNDQATAFDVAPDGSAVYVTGISQDATEFTSPDSYATIAYEASSGNEIWTVQYSGPADGDDLPRALAVTPDGLRVVVTGQSLATDEDQATVAYGAADGIEAWVQRHDGPKTGHDTPNDIATSPDGSRVFLTGKSINATPSVGSLSHNTPRSDYATVAYDASTGAELWVARYDGPVQGDDIAHSLAVSPDGSTVYVIGTSHGTDSRDYVTIAYDAGTGEELWITRHDGPATAGVASLSVALDGQSLFATGPLYGGSTTNWDYLTVAYDATTGAEYWTAKYDGPTHLRDEPSALAVSPTGSTVFVTGFSETDPGDSEYATVAYDAATGTELWVKRQDAVLGTKAAATDIVVNPDGARVFVTGHRNNREALTVAYDATSGALLWTRLLSEDGMEPHYLDSSPGDARTLIEITPDGSRVFVTGHMDEIGSISAIVIAYDAVTGATLWTGPSFRGELQTCCTAARGLAVAPDGATVVMAAQLGGSSRQGGTYRTMAYDAGNGEILWDERYGNGPSNWGIHDAPTGVAISPDASLVFVTGGSADAARFSDYGTIAYKLEDLLSNLGV